MHLAASVVLALLSALLYTLSFPPLGWHVLGWGSLVPLLLGIRCLDFKRAVLVAWLFTLAAAYGTGDWFPTAVSTYYSQPPLVGIGFFLAVSTLTAAPFFVAFAICYKILTARPTPSLVLLAPALWVASELGRARLLGGDPWALLGYSQAGALTVMQIADVTGIYGVSFILATVNVALAEACLSLTDRETALRRPFGTLTVACACVALVFLYGQLSLQRATAALPRSRPTRVAIAQANLDLGARWRRDMYGKNLDEYFRLTVDAVRGSQPALVFWPENAMTFFLEEEPLYQKAIARVLSAAGVQLVAGGPSAATRGTAAPVYYNSAFLISDSGQILGRYDKGQLLPFAEYVPLGSLDFMRRSFGRVREFSPGRSAKLLHTKVGLAGIMICNEAMFPEIAAERVGKGAEYLVNLSNDSWLRSRKYSEMALAMAAFRAVEQRRYLVRASTSGPSAVVTPLGKVLSRTQAMTRDLATGEIRVSTALTSYNRAGDLFAGVCSASGLGALLLAWLRGTITSRRHKQSR